MSKLSKFIRFAFKAGVFLYPYAKKMMNKKNKANRGPVSSGYRK